MEKGVIDKTFYDVSGIHFGIKGTNPPPPMKISHEMDGIGKGIVVCSSKIDFWDLERVKVDVGNKAIRDFKMKKFGPGLMIILNFAPKLGSRITITY
jgi:hypothetical protein